jgi:hypothetical protein
MPRKLKFMTALRTRLSFRPPSPPTTPLTMPAATGEFRVKRTRPA